MQRAVLLARYTGQRQADVLRMSPSDIEDGGINVVQQKTGKELWVPLHPDLRGALEGWHSSPYVLDRKGNGYTSDRFRAGWAEFMTRTPAGRIRGRASCSTGSAHRAVRSSARPDAATARSRLSPACRRTLSRATAALRTRRSLPGQQPDD